MGIKSLILFVCFYLLSFNFNLQAAEQTAQAIQVVVKKSDMQNEMQDEMKLLTINGMRQALTRELAEKKLDEEKFWKMIEEKKLSADEEETFLKPLFKKMEIEKTASLEKSPYYRGNFRFEFDSEKLAVFVQEVLAGSTKVTVKDAEKAVVKTFYIVSDISIAPQMSWEDVGVTKKENFVMAIVDSWKKWAADQFKDFSDVIAIEKDFVALDEKDKIHPESVTLKWNSVIKKTGTNSNKKTARFEITGQYILVNSKTQQVLIAFDFPVQKREITTINAKELSSQLASLIFNLLNSQTNKISGASSLNKKIATQNSVDFQVIGRHGLSDILQMGTVLSAQLANINLSLELKNYSNERSIISIQSSLSYEALSALLAKDGGKIPFGEQKVLLFNEQQKTFAIIPKEANN